MTRHWSNATEAEPSLLGIGIYTPTEASRLTRVSATKIRRWLRGHQVGGIRYAPLWSPQIDIGDGHTYLGFRDLTEVRVAEALIAAGVSPQKVRRAIGIARDAFGIERPLSTDRFRTDGRQVFLSLSHEDGDRIIELFSGQYQMRKVIEPSFKGLVFDDEGVPVRWRLGGGVILDPKRSFGQPIEEETFVPTSVLADAADAEGSAEAAAVAYRVPIRAVRRALAFERPAGHARAA